MGVSLGVIPSTLALRVDFHYQWSLDSSGRRDGLVPADDPDVLHTVGLWEDIEVSCHMLPLISMDQDDIWIIGIIIPWNINRKPKTGGCLQMILRPQK